MSNPYRWDRIWTEAQDDEHFWWWVEREKNGVRSREVISYIESHLGDTRGLKTIEIGSGAGVYSLVLAKRLAVATLMDYSQGALLLARKHFDSIGLSASFVCADALNLKPDLLGKFDVAMSFGTVEHYRYPERLLIAKAHTDLVRAGGIVIISVPNPWFFLHEILKFYLQKRNKWRLGCEDAFTRPELFRLGNRLGLEHIKIKGSAFITDLFRYLYIIQQTNFFQRFFHSSFWHMPFNDTPSHFDNLLGADIFLMGIKPLTARK